MPEYDNVTTADKVGSNQKTNYRTTVKLVCRLFNVDGGRNAPSLGARQPRR